MIPNLTEEVDKDTLRIIWNPPEFGSYKEDYKVEEYIIEVQTAKSDRRTYSVPFVENRSEYWYDMELDLGKKYDLSMKTSYEDIDGDSTHFSSGYQFSVFSSKLFYALKK